MIALLFTGGVSLALAWFTVPAYSEGLGTYWCHPVDAVVLTSSAAAPQGGRGRGVPIVSVSIRYRYEVAGRPYESDRAAAGGLTAPGSAAARAMAAQFPVGARVTAYYDTASPERAVLVRGVSFLPYMFSMFMVPWVMFTAAIAAGIPSMIREVLSRGTAAGLRVIERGQVCTVRLGTRSMAVCVRWWALAVTMFIIGSAIVMCGLTLAEVIPRHDAIPIGLWAVNLVIVAVVVVLWMRQVQRGRFDLVIDRGRREMRVPEPGGTRTVTLDDAMSVRRRQGTLESPIGPSNTPDDRVVVSMRDGGQIAIARWLEGPEGADEFAEWLESSTGIPVDRSQSPPIDLGPPFPATRSM